MIRILPSSKLHARAAVAPATAGAGGRREALTAGRASGCSVLCRAQQEVTSGSEASVQTDEVCKLFYLVRLSTLMRLDVATGLFSQCYSIRLAQATVHEAKQFLLLYCSS